MSETYFYVGSAGSWTFAFIPIPGLVMYCVRRYKDHQLNALTVLLSITMALCFLIGTLAQIPTEWIMAGAGVGIAATFGFLKGLTRLLRLAGIAFAILVSYCSIKPPHQNTISLHGESMVVEDILGGPRKVPREGLTISATSGERDRKSVHVWKSWSVLYTSPYEEKSGPTFVSFDMFWGPHGLVNGDTVGENLAKWANVKVDRRPL